MGFRLNLKWGFSFHPSLSTNTSSWPSSYSIKSLEAFYDSARMSSLSVIHGEIATLLSHPVRAEICSSATQVHQNDRLEKEDIENEVRRQSDSSSSNMVYDKIWRSAETYKSTPLTSLKDKKILHFGLLMKTLGVLEETIADLGVVRLERDILVQLERLGALKLFQTRLCRTLPPSSLFNMSDAMTESMRVPEVNGPLEDLVGEKVVHSLRKEERKSRRKRALDKGSNGYMQEKRSENIIKDPQEPTLSSAKRPSNYKSRRLKIARNEAEMSQGVKLVAELERVRTILEENTGQVVSMRSWAEAAQVDKKVLQQHLQFGWYCRDELLRSTRSLTLYITKSYRGLGVAFEDLVQAGNVGVLQGAEKFDITRGYKFSTYVQYWIRKSMSKLVSQHARGIRIPSSLNKAINQIQKARKALINSHGKYADDNEIAKFTGLSPARIMSASKCLRVVGSIDQKVGDSTSAKLLELLPDTSVRSPEETVVRQDMVQNIYMVLKDLEPRERQVLILRFGLRSHHRMSLEEIGKLFSVSKEWVRKIERRALTKIRKKDIYVFQNLSLFVQLAAIRSNMQAFHEPTRLRF